MALLNQHTIKTRAAIISQSRFSWFRWHRRLGLITCLGVLLWGVSGMTHPILSRLQPKPAVFMAPSQPLSLHDSLSPRQVLDSHHIEHFQRLSVVSLQDRAYFRVAQDVQHPARYFSTQDGIELQAGDRQYATMLASHYLGLPQASISSARFITAFSDDYHSINRLLPVWRVEFAGKPHLRAFIDTDQARLSTLVDDTKLQLTRLFRFGHNWAFLDAMPRLQLGLMAASLSCALFSAGSGLYLYVRRRHLAKQRFAARPVHRWHRRLGLLVALSTLMFVSSGLLHLLVSFQQERNRISSIAPTLQTRKLSTEAWQQVRHQPVTKLDLASVQGHSYWLLQQTTPMAQVAALANTNAQQKDNAQEQHHHDHQITAKPAAQGQLIPASVDTPALPDTLALATVQALVYAKLPASSVSGATLITQFGGEYGFLFKRLPVVKVQFQAAGNPRYFIEPATGALAARVTDSDAAEGWVFAYVHKWVFADGNKLLRDIAVCLFAFGNIVVALLGVYLFTRRTRLNPHFLESKFKE